MQPLRRDPAPSRTEYRLQRLWLTPWVRRATRIGPPLLLLAGIGLHAATDDEIRAAIDARYARLVASVAERDALQVTRYHITGASEDLIAAVRITAGIKLPASSLNIDVAEVREQVIKLARVRSASVRIAQGGTLEIDVTERIPAALWREAGQLMILDTEGVRLGAAAARVDHPDLPLVLGTGAEHSVGEALRLFQIAEPIRDRIRGLRRIGTRRWSIALDRDQSIELPEDEAIAALRRVLGLNAAEKLLERDVRIVDMRNPARPILRIGHYAQAELQRQQRIEKGLDQ